MVVTHLPREASAGAPATPSVLLRDVRKVFGGLVAVAGISLSVEPGEFITLLGPSGCGKTTTLRMIGGFEYPTSGTIEILGREMGGLPPYRRPVNTVFQHYALFPHMTVAANVGYGLEMARVPRDERRQRVARALELVRLPHLEKRKPTELSGGQQQRVALARALVNRPDVLLLDEPLGALDLKLRKAMQLELKRLNREVRATFIYVTHDQEEALTMSDRIAVMSEGRILQLGTPTDVYERPRNRFVADFVGQTNFLEGTLVRIVGQFADVEVPGSGIVRGRVSPGEAPAGPVTIAVRPERVALATDLVPGGAPWGWNSLGGTIAGVTYLGTHTQIVVALPAGAEVMVHRQNRTGGDGVPQPGDNALVAFDPASATVLVG
ncbi:MAG TPA: ABC transporter ATP-binding protein [Thermomicrobiales bacterium]|jgi:spermidine/putrescine transport system ATP-binding protein